VRQLEKMKTSEERVQEIAEPEEIKELTAKCAHWVAIGEGAQVARLFTDDGVSNPCRRTNSSNLMDLATTISFLKAHSYAVAMASLGYV
jgi:hypothetical protein